MVDRGAVLVLGSLLWVVSPLSGGLPARQLISEGWDKHNKSFKAGPWKTRLMGQLGLKSNGAWWLSGRFGALHPKGRRF